MHPWSHYEHLARLFDYPRHDYPLWVQASYDIVADRSGRAASHLEAFAGALPTAGGHFTSEALDAVQEVFTRTFDVQAITTLGVGYVMFGDDYKRGELLVNLSREHDTAGIDCGDELPDHLPNVLRLMARWEDRQLAAEFAEEILHPALGRMVKEFEPGRRTQRDGLYEKHYKTLIVTSSEHATMFRSPLCALLEVVKADFDLADSVPPEQDNDFLKSIGRELEIETDEGLPKASEGTR
ncbi:hypothetical protein KJ059_17165 [Myxococcota bacterium]|nr:hypothetical protein [Myxococcota bacterium]MCZ7619883.1 hypothetical protein [Myxococcota bacterium]